MAACHFLMFGLILCFLFYTFDLDIKAIRNLELFGTFAFCLVSVSVSIRGESDDVIDVIGDW